MPPAHSGNAPSAAQTRHRGGSAARTRHATPGRKMHGRVCDESSPHLRPVRTASASRHRPRIRPRRGERMTTTSCLNCYEDPGVCDKVGQDLRSCEHFVRADDIEIEPPDEMNPADLVLGQLVDRVDLIAAQMQTMQLTWDDMWAAILKARVGEGL